MSYASGRGRAVVNPECPSAFAVCDRCGAWVNHPRLSWQHQYAGPQLINLHILVCDRCLDKPAEFLRTINLPPDPVPVKNPRPEFFAQDEATPPNPDQSSAIGSFAIGVSAIQSPAPLWRTNIQEGQPVYLLVPDD